MERIYKDYDEHLLGRYAVDWATNFAAAFIERWGMVAAMPDGEDAAGRSKLRLMSPQELVDRAYETADLIVNRAIAEGRTRDLGPLTERKFLMQSYDSWRLAPVKDKSLKEELTTETRNG